MWTGLKCFTVRFNYMLLWSSEYNKSRSTSRPVDLVPWKECKSIVLHFHMSKLISIVLTMLTIIMFQIKISNRLYDNNAHPEEVVRSPAKSFIGHPINIKIPIPVGTTNKMLLKSLELVIKTQFSSRSCYVAMLKVCGQNVHPLRGNAVSPYLVVPSLINHSFISIILNILLLVDIYRWHRRSPFVSSGQLCGRCSLEIC
jgi:hypothetical protein